MTTTARIRDALEDGPATALELTYEIHIGAGAMNALLTDMYRRGRLGRTRYHDPRPGTGRKDVWMYWLPEQLRMVA